MATKPEILHVSVDKPTRKQITQLALKEDCSVSAVIRRAINAYLAGKQSEAA